MDENFNGNTTESPLLDVQSDLFQKIQNKFIPQLKDLAISRIAIRLFQNNLAFNIQSVYSDNRYELEDDYLIYNIWLSRVRAEILVKVPELSLKIKELENDLKAVIKITKNRIFIFLETLARCKLSFSLENVIIYFNSIHWTEYGIINYFETYSVLIRGTILSTVQKYALACHCCSEEKLNVVYLMDMLPNNFVAKFTEDKSFRLLLFWYFHLKHKDKEFKKILNRQEGFRGEVNEYILKREIVFENEIIVQYIWENLNDQQLEEGLHDFIVETALFRSSVYVLCYLLRQLKQPQQIEDVCVVEGYPILERLTEEYRCRDYFMVVARCALKFVRKMEFSNALRTILLCWMKDVYKRDECEKLLRESKIFFRCDIDINFLLSSRTRLLMILSNENDTLIKSFLSVRTVEDCRNFLYDKNGMEFGFNLIMFHQLDLFLEFINETLQGEQINKYKNHFLEKKGFTTCVTMVEESDSENRINRFLIAFCSNDRISSFKNELPYKNQGKLMGHFFNNKDYNDTRIIKLKIDRFLGMCFDNSEAEIMRCKFILFDLDNDMYMICKEGLLNHFYALKKRGQKRQAEKLLRWAFSTDDNVQRFKREMYL